MLRFPRFYLYFVDLYSDFTVFCISPLVFNFADCNEKALCLCCSIEVEVYKLLGELHSL